MGCSTEALICGKSLLHFVERSTCVKLLLNWGANPNVQDLAGKSVLHLYQTDLAVVKMIVESKADVNLQDNSGDTPLHITARTGQTAVAEILLRNGASTSIANNKNQTALDIAAALGHSECFKCMFALATKSERSSRLSDGSKKWKEAYGGLESKSRTVHHEKIQDLSHEQ